MNPISQKPEPIEVEPESYATGTRQDFSAKPSGIVAIGIRLLAIFCAVPFVVWFIWASLSFLFKLALFVFLFFRPNAFKEFVRIPSRLWVLSLGCTCGVLLSIIVPSLGIGLIAYSVGRWAKKTNFDIIQTYFGRSL